MTPSPLFGFGQCSLDSIGIITTYPPSDVKCEFTNMVVQGGGGVVGDDAFGATITDSLLNEGIVE